MIAIAIITVLLVLLLLFLTLPVEVVVNSEQDLYRAQIKGVLSLQLLPGQEEWKFALRAGWWKREWKLSRLIRPAKKKRRRKSKRRMRPATIWRKGRRVAGSFRVDHLRIDLDTDDYILNAYLYPVFHYLRRPRRELSINFLGSTLIDFRLTNRVGRILWAVVR